MLKRLAFSARVIALSLFLVVFISTGVFAQTSILKTLQSPLYRVDGSSGGCSENQGGNNTGASDNNPNLDFHSGLQPPYYLEGFVINVLKYLAQKTGVPESNALTKEHATALIGWFYAEGGDINQDAVNGHSPGLFNPLNTGLGADPSSPHGNLVDRHYPVRAGGLQSFISFDAGVEATTLTFLGSFQNRIGKVLTDPSASGEKVMKVIANPQDYPGNLAWATADPSAYYQSLVGNLQQARSHYDDMASTIIGTTAKEAVENKHVPTSQLMYGSGSGSTGAGSSTSTGGTSANTCDTTAVNCSNPSTTAASLSTMRQNVVCITQQELALWKSKPGYPTPSFSQDGYLKYSQNRREEWCADFATWVYDQAQYPLNPDPNWNIAYVPNIQAVGEKDNKFHWHPVGSSYRPKPGDLAIHGVNHVNIVITVNGNSLELIGGDQGSGPYPGGSIVSIETASSFSDNGITGYVSPD